MKLSFTLRVSEKYADRYDRWSNGSRFGFKENQNDFCLITDEIGRHFFLCHGNAEGEIQISGKLYQRKNFFEAAMKQWKDKQNISSIYLICCYCGNGKNIVNDDFSVIGVLPTEEEIGSQITCFADENGFREIDFFAEVSEERLSELPEEIEFFRRRS